MNRIKTLVRFTAIGPSLVTIAQNRFGSGKIHGHDIASDEIVPKNQGRVRYIANGPDDYLYVSLTSGTPPQAVSIASFQLS